MHGKHRTTRLLATAAVAAATLAVTPAVDAAPAHAEICPGVLGPVFVPGPCGPGLLGLGVTAFIALSGWHVASIDPRLLAAVAGAAGVYFLALDRFKVWLFGRLRFR